jgi:hypothetical protein
VALVRRVLFRFIVIRSSAVHSANPGLAYDTRTEVSEIMGTFRIPQSIVGIIGRGAAINLYSEDTVTIEIVNAPDGIRPRDGAVSGSGEITMELVTTKRVDRGLVTIRVQPESGEACQYSIPLRVWSPRMSFIVLCQSSNMHLGWDPRPTAQYYRRQDDELVMYEGDTGGNHAWVHARKLERIFHKWDLPITWLIDDTVAGEQATQIREWHEQYGDGVSYLPRSYFYDNKRNYNFTATADELLDVITPEYEALQASFEEKGWPIRCRTMGSDQWVGSPGSVFIDAAQKMGLEGIWGIGYDHETCDTSMYHMGCPWDIYKPKADNFRVPGTDNSFWCYQWTTRDIINTSYFRPTVGSTTFSTDADDINYNAIPRFQTDYYKRLLVEYRRNLSHHDVNVFLVHQEDHDSHIHGSNTVLENFVDQVHDLETFATLDEVTAWLNRRFTKDEHPYQLIDMSDPLTCHAQMQKLSSMGDIPKRFAANEAWGRDGKPNPQHVAYYGTDYMFIAEKGAPTPKIFYNYMKSGEYPFVEDGGYPEEDTPEITKVKLRTDPVGDETRYALTFTSAGAIESLPIVIWSEPLNGNKEGLFECIDQEGRSSKIWRTKNALVILARDVVEGQNSMTVSLQARQ